MKRQFQRLAEVLGADLRNTPIETHTINFIADRQARVLWPNETDSSKRLREQFVSDVLWYSGRLRP